MRSTRVGVWMLAVAFTTMAAQVAGCGGDKKKKKAGDPVIESITPAFSSPDGGTTITITGDNFTSGVTVTINGTDCGSVERDGSSSLTCVTPAGDPGPATVIVETGAGTDESTAFSYASRVTGIWPHKAGPGGPLWIEGEGFEGAGTNTVTVGGMACASVVVVTSGVLRCVVDAGVTGANADVVVSNDLGDSDGFSVPVGGLLIALDGTDGFDGNLYIVDPGTMSWTTAGAIGTGITGAAFADDGLLYGTEATIYGGDGASLVIGTSQLVAIDAYTMSMEVRGALLGTDGTYHDACPSLIFRDGLLHAWTEDADQFTVVDPDGTVHRLGSGTGSYGSGMAVDADGTVWLAPEGVTGVLYTLNPSTGEVTAGPTMSGGNYDAITALAFVDGTLYGVGNNFNADAELIMINTSSGAITVVSPLPPRIGALATTSP